jgi:GDPmannose 4,6-dehydratase
VREFVELAFGHVDLDWEKYVVIDPAFYRPAEVHTLRGDATKAHNVLGWKREVTFPQLVTMMVDADLQAVEREMRSK